MIKFLVDAKGNEGGVVIYYMYTSILLKCLKMEALSCFKKRRKASKR